MPKKTRYPGLRVHVRKGKNGQVWRSWYMDRRPEKDIPLGSDYTEAIRKWAELVAGKPSRGIGHAMDRWEKERLPSYTKVTRVGYEKNLKMLRPVFEPASWDGVTMKTLTDYLEARTAPIQGNREMALLSVVWHWAQMKGLTNLPWPAHGLAKSRWKNKEKPRKVRVEDDDYEGLYAHADPLLKDYLTIATATGLRVTDIIALRLTDVRGTWLVLEANKTGKGVEIDLTGSVMLDVIERRKARKVDHIFLLAHGKRPVTERMITDRFKKARESAGVAHLIKRDMRKYAADKAEDPQALLQHSNASVTKKHYLGRAKVKAAR
jgi:integrase